MLHRRKKKDACLLLCNQLMISLDIESYYYIGKISTKTKLKKKVTYDMCYR